MQNAQRSQPGTATSKPTKPAPGTAPPQNENSESAGAESTADSSGGSPESRGPTKAARLAHMLEHGTPLESGKPPAGAGTSEGEDGGSQKSKPKKFNDLAGNKALALSLDELYALEIATAADGSPVTVQTLKDHHAQRSEFSVAQLKWEEDRNRQNAELVRGNAELRELLSAIPRDKLDPAVLEKVRTKVTENAKLERTRTLEVIPDWKDLGTMEKELTGMADWLEDFGFPRDYLKTVYDHRAMLMMRTAWMREQRVKAALADMENEPPPPVGKSKPTGKAPSKQPSSEPRSRGRAGLEALLQE